MRAKVEPYISVKPGDARYLVVQGEPQQGTITQSLWAADGHRSTSPASTLPSHLKVTFREATEKKRQPEVAKGKQWRVEMTLANDAQVGALSERVPVHTTHPKQKLVQIPVSGFVRPISRSPRRWPTSARSTQGVPRPGGSTSKNFAYRADQPDEH